MSRSRRLGAALATLLPVVLGCAAYAQAQEPAPFRATVNVVRVDVSVSDRHDKAVDDLRPDDFELREDGIPQHVDTAQFLHLTGARTANTDESLAIRSREHAESEAARDDVRVFVIFLDDYHVDKDQRLTMRVKQAMTDLVKQFGPNDLVAIMDPLTTIHDLTFTRSRDDLLRRINEFEGRRGQVHPTKSVIEEAQLMRRDVWTVRGAVTLSALDALVTYLGGLREGRKSVVFVSQGPAMGRDADNRDDLDAVLRDANHGNVTINTYDPRPLGGVPLGGEEVIARLAHDTGGRAVVNSNDPRERLAQTIDDASAYYLLGYSPSRDLADGKFHKIEVRVRRPGMHVLARSGYWAPAAKDMAPIAPPKTLTPAITEALTTLVEPRSGRVADVWAGSSRGESGRTRVTVSWEASNRPDKPPAIVEIVPVDGRPRAAGAEARVLAPAQAIPSSTVAVFELEPSEQVVLRIGMKGADGDLLDRWDQRIAVPAFREAVALSTPRFLRARSAMEARALAAGAGPAPVASPRFRVTDRVVVEFDSYGSAAPEIAARLLNAKGERLIDLQAVRQSNGAMRVQLPVASIAPGTYVVGIDARLGDKEVQERAAFRVVP